MKKIITAAALAFAPVFAFAQNTTTQDALGILKVISNIINFLIPLAIAAGVLYFIWGVVQYITAKDEESQGAARKTMISGIIGLFVIVAMWGLVSVIRNTFELNGQNNLTSDDIPCVPGTYVIDPGSGNQMYCN
jgi:hypothetical protein